MKTGHVKQVAAFGKLVGLCNDLGARYNPSKASLTPIALAALLEQAQQSLEAMNSARATFILAVNNRKESYAGISRLAARIVHAVGATDGSTENKTDVRSIKRKLLSKASGKVLIKPPKTETSVIAPKQTRSSSHLDFDSQAETFANLLHVVQAMPTYNPNEADLKITALKEVLDNLHTQSEKVAQAANAFSNARIARNNVILGKGGIYETGTATKEYIRSVFGPRSEPSRELGKIRLLA